MKEGFIIIQILILRIESRVVLFILGGVRR